MRRPSREERARAARERQRQREHQLRAVLFGLIALVWMRPAVQGVQAFLYRPGPDTMVLAAATAGIAGGSGLIALRHLAQYLKKR